MAIKKVEEVEQVQETVTPETDAKQETAPTESKAKKVLKRVGMFVVDFGIGLAVLAGVWGAVQMAKGGSKTSESDQSQGSVDNMDATTDDVADHLESIIADCGEPIA